MRFTQVKRDKNVNFLCVFEENEKWRSFNCGKKRRTIRLVIMLNMYVLSFILLHTNYIIAHIHIS